MACAKCGAPSGHKKDCPTLGGRASDRGRAKGQKRARSKGIMKGSGPKVCRTCSGSGSKNGRVCPDCQGSGEK